MTDYLVNFLLTFVTGFARMNKCLRAVPVKRL